SDAENHMGVVAHKSPPVCDRRYFTFYILHWMLSRGGVLYEMKFVNSITLINAVSFAFKSIFQESEKGGAKWPKRASGHMAHSLGRGSPHATAHFEPEDCCHEPRKINGPGRQ
ncbi:MAG: hypothetical protein VCE91_15015, partial [Nitrospinota bacterium]